MKVAIIHPWFLEFGGGERVVDALIEIYPDADIFALSVDPSVLSPRLRGRKIYVSYLNRLLRTFMRYKRTYLMLLYPCIIEGFDVSRYDLVISSCPPVMGVNVSQNAMHICYCHTPQISWWHLYTKRQREMSWFTRQAFICCASLIRIWEFCAIQRIDHVVSNSNYIARRVQKYFCRKSNVIYPPVNTSIGYLSKHGGDYYLSVSRLAIPKRIDLVILACNRLKRTLLIAGSGRAEAQLKVIAGPTIKFLGYVPDEHLPELYANCRAFLFAADEDFGIAPIEAQAFGRPVIAYGHGGSLETVRVGDPKVCDTGVFFNKQTVESMIDGIRCFEANESRFVPQEIQNHARQFDTSVFIEKFRAFVDEAMAGVNDG